MVAGTEFDAYITVGTQFSSIRCILKTMAKR